MKTAEELQSKLDLIKKSLIKDYGLHFKSYLEAKAKQDMLACRRYHALALNDMWNLFRFFGFRVNPMFEALRREAFYE